MIGTSLAHYRIDAKLGQGGMGEVWRATDSRLGRAVALKLLPEAFARDAERLARFQREAQLLASLNHPNIGAIYGLEHHGGRHALVLELVDGPTLSDRIREGALPPREALAIARQIADALQAAHERGIIHRDLKPDNVKLTADGRVKVLDFGLAKALDDAPAAPGSGDFMQSPTLSPALSAMTAANVILGTAGYMSPEQARGQAADRRSDIWAFGVMLFEMLTGRRLFAGDTVSDSLAAVLKTEPDWESLPPALPAAARRLLRRCLEKNAKLRLHDIADARLDLDEAIAAPEEPVELAGAAAVAAAAAGRAGRRAGAVGIAVGAAALALSLWAPWRGDGPLSVPSPPSLPGAPGGPARVLRLAIPTNHVAELPGWLSDYPLIAISADGTRVAYTSMRDDGPRLILRDLESGEERALAAGEHSPFFEPGGARVGFLDPFEMVFVRPEDSSPTLLTHLGPVPRGAFWGEDGRIVFPLGTDNGLTRLDPRTGTVDTLTALTEGGETRSHRWPAPLPGGRALLYTAGTETILSFDEAGIFAVDLRTGESRYLADGSSPRYAGSGHLVWARNGTLFAAAFDPERLELLGEPVPVLRGVATRPASGAAHYSFSDDGTLVYLPGEAASASTRLEWVDRQGNVTPIEMPRRSYASVAVSPDGTRLACEIDDANANIWIWDLQRSDLTRLSFVGNNNRAVWAPDGSAVYYSSARGGGRTIYRQAVGVSADAEPVAGLDALIPQASISPDGRMIAFMQREEGLPAIRVRRLDGDGEARALSTSGFPEWSPVISPDGRWLAYCSNESGVDELYLRPFPEGDGRWKVSVGGAELGRWAPDGSRLYWVNTDGGMMEAEIVTEPAVRIGRPRELFRIEDYAEFFDVAPDGRFLVIRDEPTGWRPDRVVVVVNWFEELKRLVPR